MHHDETRDLFDRAARPALAALKEVGTRAPASLRDAFDELRRALFEPEPETPAADDGETGRELLAFFRQETGLTPQGFLRECRLETMAWLLILSDLSLAEIGERIGYLEPSSLRRAFKTWSGGLTPHGFRVQMRKLAADERFADPGLVDRSGLPPEETFSWYGWYRLEQGWLSDAEIEAKLSVLERVYGLAGPGAGAAASRDPLARLAAELAKVLDPLPWTEQRRVTRESIRFSTPHFFDRLCALSRDLGPHDRERAAQLMVLALDSLEARQALRGEPDPGRAALAWTRLAYLRWRLGDLAGAEQALEAAADRPAPPDRGTVEDVTVEDAAVEDAAVEDAAVEDAAVKDGDDARDAERACLEAAVLWGLGRPDPAMARADEAVTLLANAGRGDDAGLRSRALLLRAALHAYAPRKPDVEALLEELGHVREMLDGPVRERLDGPVRGRLDERAAELLELDDLWLRLHAMQGDDAELLRAATRARARAERLGADRARCRCLWYEGFAHRRQGDARRAETRWREARLGLLDLDLETEAAPVTLELTVLCLAADRFAEAASLARALIATLEASGIDRDSLGAISALRRALSADTLTLEDLKPLRRIVAAFERDVKARRGPAFEL